MGILVIDKSDKYTQYINYTTTLKIRLPDFYTL